MIARIFIILLVAIVLPDVYLDRHILRRLTKYTFFERLLWWIPSIILVIYTLFLTFQKNFAPDNNILLNLYLLLLGIIIIPKAIFALCSFLGWIICRLCHKRNNWGNIIGLLLGVFIIFVTIYGSTIGFRKLEVYHVDYYSKQVPKSFDGYRIVHFSDLHLGTYNGHESMVEKIVDSINAQKPDLVAFTGDIENMQPKELYPFIPILSKIKARDGVYSVLGNHDYAGYIKADDLRKVANEKELVSLERQFGWNLLLNSNKKIKRSKKDYIVIAGMENDGRPPFPQKSDISKALKGVNDNAFVIMLEHDPTSWERTILPESKVELTLSGHTHAMQFGIFGWSPSALVYKQWGGMYYEDDRAINVSKGAGGFIPFRFGASNEIVVITLHHSDE